VATSSPTRQLRRIEITGFRELKLSKEMLDLAAHIVQTAPPVGSLFEGMEAWSRVVGQIGPQYQSDARALNVFRAQRQRCPETDSTRGSSMRKPVITFPLFWIMR
jgi:hypothetical protein